MQSIMQFENVTEADGRVAGTRFKWIRARHGWSVLVICLMTLALHGMVFPPAAFSEEDEVAGLTELLRKDPNNIDLLKQRAALLRLEQRFSESLGDLDRARLLNPDDPQIGLLRALTLSALRRDQDAEVELEIFLGLVKDGPARAIALAERGHIRARTLRPVLAIADFTAAIAIQPALDLYLARGKLQESQGQLGAAAVGYQAGIARLGRGRRSYRRTHSARTRARTAAVGAASY